MLKIFVALGTYHLNKPLTENLHPICLENLSPQESMASIFQ